MSPYSKEVSKVLVKTPLIIKQIGQQERVSLDDEYFIDVKSIRIDGKVVPLKSSFLSISYKNGLPVGGTKLSITTLRTSFYKAVVKDFVNKAAAKNITRVTSVAPFGACFSSKNIGSSKAGPEVPLIDLVLQSIVKWRIYGANLMVRVNDKVWCLAFVNGGRGSKARTSIVIGGHQMEDNFLEFDLNSSKLGFTSFLRLDSSCSHDRYF